MEAFDREFPAENDGIRIQAEPRIIGFGYTRGEEEEGYNTSHVNPAKQRTS